MVRSDGQGGKEGAPAFLLGSLPPGNGGAAGVYRVCPGKELYSRRVYKHSRASTAEAYAWFRVSDDADDGRLWPCWLHWACRLSGRGKEAAASAAEEGRRSRACILYTGIRNGPSPDSLNQRVALVKYLVGRYLRILGYEK